MTLNLNEPNVFTTKFVHEGLVLGRKLGNHFQREDVNVDRGLKFQQAVNDQLKQYEEFYKYMTNKNKQQRLISEFFPKYNSQQTLTTTNSVNGEEKSNEIILSSDESEIIQLRKRKHMVKSHSDKVWLKIEMFYL